MATDEIASEVPLVLNNKLLVHISSPNTGNELYAIDIVTGNSVLLKDIYVGGNSSWDTIYGSNMAVFNGKAWFFARGSSGYNLWTTDGTPENTVINFSVDVAFPWGGNTGILWPVGDKLFAYFGSVGYGNLAAIISDNALRLLGTMSIEYMATLNDKFVFKSADAHGSEPWISDGTVSGTKIIKDINTDEAFRAWKLRNVGSHIVFGNNAEVDGVYGYELWSTNGQTSGTQSLAAFQNLFVGDVAVNGDKFIFQTANDGRGSVWVSDGTKAQTKLLKEGDWYYEYSAGSFEWEGDKGYIFSDRELWKTTFPGPTEKIKDLPFSFTNGKIIYKGILYFFLSNELWRSDGTTDGTYQVKQLKIGERYSSGFMKGTNAMFFVGRDNTRGPEIWTSDGTADGTHIVKDLHQGSAFDGYTPKIGAVTPNNYAYFVGSESGTNYEMWRTDGTDAGTVLVKEIYPGETGSNPYIIGNVGNTVYFTANDGVHGYELWRTDDVKGTVMIKDIAPGVLSSVSSGGLATQFIDNVLYFAANDEAHGTELWKTDGTEEGTILVADVNPGILSGVLLDPNSMGSIGTTLIFTGRSGAQGFELWKYLASGPVTVKSPQTITFQPIGDKTTNDLPFNLTASSSSGLPIAYEVVSGPATISGSTLTITGSGSVTVRATQGGNDDYNEASAEQSFNVILATGLEDEEPAVIIWPNPATTTIVVNHPQSALNHVSLKDIFGREIVSTAIAHDETSLNVGDLPRGIYILRLNGSGNRSITKKIILK